jgi:hypothetical protein
MSDDGLQDAGDEVLPREAADAGLVAPTTSPSGYPPRHTRRNIRELESAIQRQKGTLGGETSSRSKSLKNYDKTGVQDE